MTATGVSQLIVVGASSGGLEALGALLGSLPADLPAPVVIAQHLAPERRSRLGEILEGRTAMEVRSVDGTEKLRAGVAYVVPAAHDVTITDHHVSVEERHDRYPPKPSVDRLLRTAAASFGESLIAVILTGEGSDGAEGARLVKAAGGTVIIEDPATASHPAMPLSLAPSIIDFTASIDRIGGILRELLERTDRLAGQDQRSLADFLDEVRDRTGIDFSAYKTPTIQRRLARRMAAVGAADQPAYERHLAEHPEEYERLASTFLIKVTDFFRDPDLFDYLRTEVVPGIVEHARAKRQDIRVWSAGCATGEETYSLAILLAETLGPELPRISVRVFGTDLDNEAIEFARRGIYTRSAVASMPDELVERYFEPAGEDLEVRKQIRAITVFGQHDLAQRAPFPRIDLTVSRNVLIYFTSELQKRALQLFAFSLRDDGVLVLGKAETPASLPDQFRPLDARLKVYRRHGARSVIPPARGRWLRDVTSPAAPRISPAGRSPEEASGRQTGRAGAGAGSRDAEAVLLRAPVGTVLVDQRYDILLINAVARRLLEIHTGAVGQDLIHAATRLPSADLRRGLDAALAGTESTIDIAVEDTAASGPVTLRLTFQPNGGGAAERRSAAVWIEDVSRLVGALEEQRSRAETSASEADRSRRRLESLVAANGELAAANHELTVANAELRSANEELLVGSEEIQAASEEVETLNEELQATNEELETLNEELQATVEELDTTNDDLEARTRQLEAAAALLRPASGTAVDRSDILTQHLLEAVEGIVVLDPAGRPVGTGGLANALTAGEITRRGRGRPLLGVDGIITTLAEGRGVDLVVTQTTDGHPRRLAVRGEPLRTPGADAAIVGGVLLFRAAEAGNGSEAR